MHAAVDRREFSARLSQRCTCVVETESDSEAESEHGLLLDGAASSPMTRPRRRSGSGASSSSTHSRSSSPSPPAVTVWAKSLSLLELARSTSSSSVRDPIKTSQALHNSEALRMAQALPNVFCACYDAETVLSTIQRRERGFSPVQRLLLEPESIAKVFEFATSVPERSRRQESSASASATASGEDLRERYHRAFLAMEIVLRFYLKAMAWHGEPGTQMDGQDEEAAEVDIDDASDDEGEESDIQHQEGEQNKLQSASRTENAAAPELAVAKASPQQLASTLNYTGGFRRHASATRKNFRMHVSMRLESSSGSFSDDYVDGEDDGRSNSAARGFILRLEELSSTQWKRIFAGLYRILWGPSPAAKSEGGKTDTKVPSSLILGLLKPHAEEDEPTIDSILAAYMCRITKNLIVFPSVHRMICEIEAPVEPSRRKETVLERLAFHAYNPEIASLLHGMIHLAHRRQLPFERGIKCIVRRAIDRMPTRPARTLSTASSTSTSSSTSSLSPTSALSPSSILNGFSPSSSTSQSVFSSRRPIAHERITGCVGILTKILSQEFPNTFRYYIQTRVQLASFENVEAFERELFPPKLLPNDPSIHEGIKNAVLDALLDNPDVITRLAELGTAELRFLEANQANGVGTPTNLVVDALRLVIECSLNDSRRLDQLVVPIQGILESVCASINYHQHLSTISEFASRDCFSDSDSDESADEDVSDASSASIGDDTDEQVAARIFGTRDGSVMSFRVSSPVINASKPSKTIVNNRPLTSPLLVVHVIELLDAIIRMSRDTVDTRLTRFDLARSLLDIFEKFPKANILHCRLLKLYLNLLDRETSNERVNNPLLRSVFRPPESVLAFIMHKLHKSGASHQYDAHLAILGVKIDKISSAPTLQQELVRQYCHNTTGWADFASSLVASHYQQMDALDESLFGLSAHDESGGLNGHAGGTRSRGSSGDGMEDMIPLSRPSSSASEYLSRELIPFRRLPVEKEGFGSAQNLASGNEAVHPTDMFRSRTQSRYSESIIDILRSDTTTSFDAVEDDLEISGCAYQKRANWARVSLKFDKHTCELTIQDVAPTTVTSPPNVNGGLSSPSSKAKALASTSTSKLKQFLLSRKQYWNSRPKKLVVCNARKWIAFGRSIKNPSVGAFGFQVEVFDGHREVDETLTFVTRSEATRTRWFEAMQDAVAASRSGRSSLTDVDEAANITLVECVATNRMGLTSRRYLAVPDVNLLSPLIPSNFILKSDVPEEVPFWGSFHGAHGVSKYVSLFNRCLRVASVEEKRMHASGYSVIVEFDATFQAADTNLGGGNGTSTNTKSDATPRNRASVRCSCTDTYLISGNQIIGLTRTIADSEKLLQLLHDDA